MDIFASYKWLKEYIKTDLAPDALAREVSLRSMSVEKVEDLGARFAHIVVGLVNEVRPHPNADRLRVVTVNVGAETTDIVCGGTNVVVGMKVCVALPGSRVRWHGEGDLVTLAETEIRGVKSVGMICAAGEVGFPELETGEKEIWDLSTMTNAKAGTPIAEALGLNDTLFTIEVTTNRPDAKGMVGMAREAATATGAEFVEPQITSHHPQPLLGQEGSRSAIPFTVAIDDKTRCFRQMAVVIDGVHVAPSPWWMQSRLLLAGIRPINNVVDITNYVMLEYAQPLHAFDYKAIDGSEIRVRRGKPGEKIVALNGKEYDVNDVLVLADSNKPLDVAGIMGGEHTGTTAATTTVVLSASAFEPVAIRRTARALNLQSDAQLLFEKGLSTEALPSAIGRAAELMVQLTGGHVASAVCDERAQPYAPLVFPLRTDMVRRRIGVDITDDRMADILTSLGFTVDRAQSPWQVTVPYWRDHDIEAEVDLTEEIARIYGYHEMPSVLLSGEPPATVEDVTLTWERELKRMLAASGYDEFFGNSFVAEADLVRYGEDPAQAYAIMNPLSAEHTHMRTTLVPSVLMAIARNQGHTASGRFFELSRVYLRRGPSTGSGQIADIPDERMQLVFGEFGETDGEGAFMRVKGTVDMLAAKTGLALEFVRDNADPRWHGTRTACVVWNGTTVGRIGEVSAETQAAFGVDRRVMLATLDLEALFPAMRRTSRYTPVPEFPAMTRDISVMLPERTPFADVAAALSSGLVRSVRLADIYRGNGVPEGKKSVTLSLVLRADDRTLTGTEAEEALATAGKMLETQFGGILRA